MGWSDGEGRIGFEDQAHTFYSMLYRMALLRLGRAEGGTLFVWPGKRSDHLRESSIPGRPDSAATPVFGLTAADLERAADRIRRLVWAKRIYDKCLGDADADIGRPWDKLPAKDDPEHRRVPSRLFSTGLAYALSGDKRYAQWSRDGLLAYADLYPRLPLTNGRCKVFQDESLCEAEWVVQIAQAYDLVANSGVFTEEQKKHVENDLLRAVLYART